MLDIVRYYNWTYVSTVYTDGNYGQSGIAAFKELAEENNVCIAQEDAVLSNAEDHVYDEVISELMDADNANVVVCFCEGMTVRNLYRAAQRGNVTTSLLFIGSDGWADRTDVVEGLEETFLGGISVKIKSPYVTTFDQHYFKLKPLNNPRNPWFEEFWQYKFNCSLPVKEKLEGLPNCTGNESLAERYNQDTKMSFVMKAVYTMAHGLHNLQRDVCGDVKGICQAMLPINGSRFRNHLMNVTFDYLNETVSFDSSGDPPGRYEIMNFQRLQNGSYDYVLVGTWNNGTLEMHDSQVIFNSPDRRPPVSVCSNPCQPGEAKSFPETGDEVQACCWICDECQDGEYLYNETTCKECPLYYWPTQNKTGCEAIEVEYPKWDDDHVIAGLVLAALGFLATTFTMVVFIYFNHTPLVKASTRELTYIIFLGMMVSYASSLPLLAEPTLVSCTLSRLLPGISFSMIYAALVTKTNRIARILAGNKKIMTRKLKFMSATAQVVITLVLISVEVVIIVAMFILEPPGTIKRQDQNVPKVVLECNSTALGITAPLAWDFFLVVMCTLYAIKTRNLPENFNEAKFIGFSMYTTCVIWLRLFFHKNAPQLAWVPIYFGSNHKIICMSVCTSLSAMVTLALLFFPKLYIMLVKPERNDRSFFKTATTVRCHFGSSKALGGMDSNDLIGTPGTFMGVAALMGAGHSLRQPIMSRLKSALHFPPSPTMAQRMHPHLILAPKPGLKRELSQWSEASGSVTTATIQARELMLQRAYGSQLDLTGDNSCFAPWSREHASAQTTDDLLDPLIPRLRRRVARAVRENSLDSASGREFFSLTHGWVTSQMEAAKAEKKRLEARCSESAIREDPHKKTEIVREYLMKDCSDEEPYVATGEVREATTIIRTTKSAGYLPSHTNDSFLPSHDKEYLLLPEKEHNKMEDDLSDSKNEDEHSYHRKEDYLADSKNNAGDAQEAPILLCEAPQLLTMNLNNFEEHVFPIDTSCPFSCPPCDAVSKQNNCEIDRKCSSGNHRPLTHKPNIFEISRPECAFIGHVNKMKKDSPSTDFSALRNFFTVGSNNLDKGPSPNRAQASLRSRVVDVTPTKSIECRNNSLVNGRSEDFKQTTFSNSQYMVITSKCAQAIQNIDGDASIILMQDENSGSPLNYSTQETTRESNKFENENAPSLKHSSSLKFLKDKIIHDKSASSSCENMSLSYKSLSSDTVNNFELVEDQNLYVDEDSHPFKSKIVRRRKGSFPYARILESSLGTAASVDAPGSGELKTIIISIGNKNAHHQFTTGTSDNPLFCDKKNSSESKNISDWASVFPDCQNICDDPNSNKKTVILDVIEKKPEGVAKSLSIRDEIDPNPRPERFQAIRTRRLSGKKFAQKTKYKQKTNLYSGSHESHAQDVNWSKAEIVFLDSLEMPLQRSQEPANVSSRDSKERQAENQTHYLLPRSKTKSEVTDRLDKLQLATNSEENHETPDKTQKISDSNVLMERDHL